MKKCMQKGKRLLALLLIAAIMAGTLFSSVLWTLTVSAADAHTPATLKAGTHSFLTCKQNGEMIFTGAWGENASEGFVDSNEAGATVTFAFEGKKAELYSNRNDWSGVMDVSLDGGEAVEVDLYSAANMPGALAYTVEAAESGVHQVKITVKENKPGRPNGAGYVGFLRVVVEAAQLPGVTTLKDGTYRFLDYYPDQGMLFDGWRAKTSDGFVDSNTVGASITFAFEGTRARIFGDRNNWVGVMGVSVDGGETVEVDCYHDTMIYDKLYYEIQCENEGVHTVVLSVLQDKPGRVPEAGYLSLTRLIIGETRNDLTVLGSGLHLVSSYFENGILFDDGWNANTKEAFVDSNTVGSKATFRFSGSKAALYGNCHSWVGKMAIQLDSEEPVVVDGYLPAGKEKMNTLLWQTENAGEGEHTVTVTVLQNDAGRPAEGGYAVMTVIRVGETGVLTRGDYNFVELAENGEVLATNTWSKPEHGKWYEAGTRNNVFELRFEGRYAAVYGNRNVDSGKIEVCVDDGDPVTVDLYQSYSAENALYYETSLLDSGVHTLTVKVLGEKNVDAAGTLVQPQRIVIMDTPVTLRVEHRDENGAEIADAELYPSIPGKPYRIERMYLPEYEYVSVSAPEQGVYPEHDLTVVYTYRHTGVRTAADYYLDAETGSDENDGRSAQTAWKTLERVNEFCFMPGDRLLIKSGTCYKGMLYPHGSGSAEAPFVIDSYGGDILPVIDGGGETPVAVYLMNSEYVEINHLEVTNWNDTPGHYAGIMVDAWNTGRAMQHVYIRNCYVHDINGRRDWCTCDWMKKTGGIVVTSSSVRWLDQRTDPSAAKADQPTVFHDVRIENNKTYMVGSVGVQVGNSEVNRWCHRTTPTDAKWVPFEDVVIRGNYIHGGFNAANDNKCSDMAALMFSCKNVVCEKNFVTDWIGSGLETWNSENVLFQFNEVQRIDQRRGGTDSCAFDSDARTINVTIQYNYIHDNGVGILFCGAEYAIDNVARYNLMINNGEQFSGWVEVGEYAHVYNNTVINTKDHESWFINTFARTDKFLFENNIFYATGASSMRGFWLRNGAGSVNTFRNNVYAGDRSEAAAGDTNPIFIVPQFVQLKVDDLQTAAGAPCITTPEVVARFRLVEDSELNQLGIAITDNGGRDLFGTPIPESGISLGAIQLSRVQTPELLEGSLTLKPQALTYGERLGTITITGTMQCGGETVSGSFIWADSAICPDAGNYEAEWIFLPEDGTRYQSVHGTVQIPVAKAAVSGTPGYQPVTGNGKTLRDAELTAEGRFSAPGAVYWIDESGVLLPDSTPVEKNVYYRWVFLPNDSGNYEALYGSIQLWKEEGKPGKPEYVPGGNRKSENKLPFSDVSKNAYYYDAVQWAVEQEITTGMDSTHFAPDGICTRAQAVTFLWRAAGSPRPKAEPMIFSDVQRGSFCYDAVLWATQNGIVKGVSATEFAPDASCTRAQIVTMLFRANGSPAVSTRAAFADVDQMAFYARPVAWAVAEGITTGAAQDLFDPNGFCTRAQIVTFLYRSMH